MNILLIGNGFDLAHELPTSYGDFLNYVELPSNPKTTEMMRNFWISGFLNKKGSLGQNWIDIESEISLVIQCLEIHLKESKNSHLNITEFPVLSRYFETSKMNSYLVTGVVKLTNDELVNLAINELDSLIAYLEIYLIEIEKCTIQKKSPDIMDLEIDKVLTFNYTNTYDDIYKKSVEYDFIHGKIGNRPNNMVLGIDEYLSDTEKDSNLVFIRFKKYFQRIQKRTGCGYKSWFEDIASSWCKWNREPVYTDDIDYCDRGEENRLLGYQCPPDANLYV